MKNGDPTSYEWINVALYRLHALASMYSSSHIRIWKISSRKRTKMKQVEPLHGKVTKYLNENMILLAQNGKFASV